MTPDVDLVNRARNHDLDAFSELVRRYQRSVLAVVRARIRDWQTAEDVTQTAFLRAFSSLSTLKDGASFGGWISRIAIRLAIDQQRFARLPVAAGISPDDCAASAAAGSTSFESHEELLHRVDQLPEQERLLIGMRHFDGLSVAEIAAATGRSTGTVTKQLSRAYARLRQSSLVRER